MAYRWFILMGFIWMAPVLAHSATYYVARTGSNSNTCNQAQSVSTPKLTIAAGLACLSGGDTLVVGTGTYLEIITGDAIPSGLSTAQRTRVIGNAGAKWTIKTPTRTACTSNSGAIIRITNRNFIDLADFIIDGRINDGGFACPNGVVLSSANDNYIHDVEIHHTSDDPGYGSAILFNSSTSHHNHVKNLLAHDIGGVYGVDTAHCIYFSGNDNIIEHTQVYNCPGHGIHYYDGASTANNHRNIIRWNYVHDVRSYGIGVYNGGNNEVYGNIIANSGETNGSLRVSNEANTKVYNNTIYNNAGLCIRVVEGSTGTIVRNNVCVDNGNNTIDTSTAGNDTVTSNNHFGTDETVFVNAANNLFSPRESSVLIDAGTSTGIPSGFHCIGTCDQGALEFGANAVPNPGPMVPTAPVSLQVTPY